MDGTKYVLDANVFITAARQYYGLDFVPGFWEGLLHHAEDGRVQSIDRVKWELDRLNDPLSEWAGSQFNIAFQSTNVQNVIKYYGEIMRWVNEQEQYFDTAKNQFASGADGWLIAYALEHRCTVVTHEVFNSLIKRTVPIPNVCQQFDIEYIDTFAMLRELSLKLLCSKNL